MNIGSSTSKPISRVQRYDLTNLSAMQSSNDEDDDSFEGELSKNVLIAKDGTQWQLDPLRSTQTSRRNIILQQGGAAFSVNLIGKF
ncbi:unnamed protein product, partial [Brenthis ino]